MPWQARCNQFEQVVDSELEIQPMDLQFEKVLNENLNLPKGIIYCYYVDIDKQCENDDFQLNNKRGISNDVLDLLIDIGFESVNHISIHTSSNNL
jgi:hypothetical protein